MGGNPLARGTSNANVRGSSYDRRKRKQYVLDRDGNGVTVDCFHCAVTLTFQTLTIDRIKPGCQGGTYAPDNIRPACGFCNSSLGGKMKRTCFARSDEHAV